MGGQKRATRKKPPTSPLSHSAGSDYEDDSPEEPRNKSQMTVEERRAVRLEKNRQSAALSRTRKKEAVTKLQSDLNRMTSDNQNLRDQLDKERRTNWECRLHMERLEKQMLAVCNENLEFRARLKELGVAVDSKSAGLSALLAVNSSASSLLPSTSPLQSPAAVSMMLMSPTPGPSSEPPKSMYSSAAASPPFVSNVPQHHPQPAVAESGLHQIAALIAEGQVTQLPVAGMAAFAPLPDPYHDKGSPLPRPSILASSLTTASAAQALHSLSTFQPQPQVQGGSAAVSFQPPDERSVRSPNSSVAIEGVPRDDAARMEEQ